VLLVMPRERRANVLGQIEAVGIEVVPACDLGEARAILRSRSVDVILTDTVMRDGGWRDLMAHLATSGLTAEVIVCAERLNHTLCAEAFGCGASDVIAEPYTQEALRAAIEGAAARNYMRSLRSNSLRASA
jgi:DNA-binding NtrC family response regulator